MKKLTFFGGLVAFILFNVTWGIPLGFSKDIRVFIHGTALYCGKNCVLDAWNKTPLRNAYTGPYLGPGLVKVQPEVLEAFARGDELDEESQIASSTHILGAYEAFDKHAKHVNLVNQVNNEKWDLADAPDLNSAEYYVFGWSGAFDREERVKAASELYETLLEVKQPGDELTLITHSHGSLALFLPDFYSDEEPLEVERLILYAPPLAEDTARLAFDSRVFREVFNFYSEGDFHQGKEFWTVSPLSLWQRIRNLNWECSKNTFAAFQLGQEQDGGQRGGGRVYDIRLDFNRDSMVFGHNHLFTLNRQSGFSQIWPLPVCVLTPQFLEVFRQRRPTDRSQFVINIQATEEPEPNITLTLFNEGAYQAAGERVKIPVEKFSFVVQTSRKNFKGFLYWIKRGFSSFSS